MKTLILILCGIMLLSTQGHSMAHFCGPFGPDELKNKKNLDDHGIIIGGSAKDDGIHYTAESGDGLKLSLGNKDPYWPSLDKEKAFSIAMTFKAGSLKSTDGKQLDLFSSFFRLNPASTTGFNMGISYDGKSFHTDIKEDKPNAPKQLTGDFSTEDLTIVINQVGAIGSLPGDQNKLSITFYAGRTNLGTIDYGSVFASNNVCYDFTLGSSDTSLILKGLQIIVNGSLTDEKAYFDKVGVQSVPEPGTAILALWGGVLTLCYRRRRAA